MEENYKELIGLKIIYIMKDEYPNAFRIYRFLERFFDIFAPSYVFNNLLNNELIISKTKEFKKQYIITSKGLTYLKQNEKELKKFLENKFVDKKKLIDDIFSDITI